MRQIHKRIHEEGTKAIAINLLAVTLLVVGMNLLWHMRCFRLPMEWSLPTRW